MDRRYVGLALGLALTALVVGLIVYGNFFATSTHRQDFEWAHRPDLYICDTAPEWATGEGEALLKATDWWEKHGFAFNNIESGPCQEVCNVKVEGQVTDRVIPCNPGRVTLDLRDGWFSEDHAGECLHPTKPVLYGADWATILVPSVIYGSDDIDAPSLPPDVNAQVLAHEIGHCLVGVDHNLGPPVGCMRLNSKTGSMMNPSIYGGGWVDEGLPAPPAEW